MRDNATARPWPEGSAFFRRAPRFAGGDSAYSVALDAERVLWLFGDTFVDPAADGSRTNGPNYFVRNSAAIQRAQDAGAGHDASRDGFELFVGPERDGAPSSFFHDIDGAERWVWPLTAVQLPGGPLLIFRMHLARVQGGLGFAVQGWDAVAIDDPAPPPSAWQPRVVQPLATEPAWIAGSAALVHEGFLYTYATRNHERDHAIALARWSLVGLGALAEGALADPEWYAGAAGFVSQRAGGVPSVLFADGQTELSVHYDARRQRFVELQMKGLWLSDPDTALGYRMASSPEGPWGALAPVLRLPEAARPDAKNLVAYAGKAHVEQRGAELIASYVVHDLTAPIPGDALYYPQLVRVSLP